MKILLGCVGVLLVLSGLLAAALMAPDQAETSSEERIPLISGDVTSVTVNNEKGTVRLVNRDGRFAIEGMEDLPASDNAAALAGQAGGLEALRDIPPAEDLEQFGLAEPAVTAAIETSQGSHRLALGGEAPASSGRYAALDGKVYLIGEDALSAFAYGPEDYVSVQVTEPLDQDGAVESVTLNHGTEILSFTYVPEKTAPQSVKEEASSSGDASTDEAQETIPAFYRMTAPLALDLEKYDVSGWANGAFGLSAQRVEVIRPDETELAAYGLDNPETVLTAANTAGDTVKLLASAPVNGSCYLMREGVPLIYRVSQSDVPWRTVSVETLTKSVFGPVDAAGISILEIEGQGAQYRFVRENGSVTAGGKSVTETAFEQVVDAALRMPPAFLGEASVPTLEPAMTVKVSYADPERESDTLRLIPTGTGGLYLERNGEIRFTTQESAVQTLLDACESALAEEQSS